MGTFLLLLQLFSFVVHDNSKKLEFDVHIPKGAKEVRVEIWCEHLNKSTWRGDPSTLEHFKFADLHYDAYEMYADIVKADGKLDHIERLVFVTN